jgi:FtsH-binding integral membrane protein
MANNTSREVRQTTPALLHMFMRNKKEHIVSAIVLSIGCLTLTVVFSGAPLRVHIVDALSLIIAFTIPAVYITKKEDIKNKRVRVISYWLLGTLVWYFLSSLVIVKADLSLLRLVSILPASFIVLIVFIAFHLVLMKFLAYGKNE